MTGKTDALPIAVDLDGTLIRTDTLYELIAGNLFRRPFKTLAALAQIVRGRAAMKAALFRVGSPDAEHFPLNGPVIDYLKAEKQKGRYVHLATAANERIAASIAERIDIFDSFHGSTPDNNLKGRRKLEVLQARFPDGFIYAGDSRADLDVWAGASGMILTGTSSSVRAKALALQVPVEAEFPADRPPALKVWRKALRLHQWSKNILIFAPLFLAHAYADPGAILRCILGFVIVGIVASGTYLINDLADLAADRQHATKNGRPLASGDLPVSHGLVAAPLLIGGGLLAAVSLNPVFAGFLLVYLVTTLCYSFAGKRVPFLDVFILGALYTIRILIGTALIHAEVSEWLLTFSFFFFLSLSIAKRHVEISSARDRGDLGPIPGRGYQGRDWPLTLAWGTAASVASILVMILYLVEDAMPDGAYRAPEFLWAAPVLVALWTSRIWLLADRGELDDDPVAFAINDRISLLLGVLFGVAFFLAVLW